MFKSRYKEMIIISSLDAIKKVPAYLLLRATPTIGLKMLTKKIAEAVKIHGKVFIDVFQKYNYPTEKNGLFSSKKDPKLVGFIEKGKVD